jgi:dTDP-4-dehydrorhamnose 3,5-epimerase
MREPSYQSSKMRINKCGLPGLLLIEPQCFEDDRGFFIESFHLARYRDHGIRDNFVQDNHSRSVRDVLRGLHFQIKHPQAQLVTVIRGRVFDVAVDLRRDSANFGRWCGVELNEHGPRQLYMAAGFAHGFCVLSEFADLHYKVSQFYDATDEGGIYWGDRDISIRWPVDTPVVSERDNSYPRLCQLGPAQLPSLVEQ